VLKSINNWLEFIMLDLWAFNAIFQSLQDLIILVAGNGINQIADFGLLFEGLEGGCFFV